MRKLIVVFFISLMLFGCSNGENKAKVEYNDNGFESERLKWELTYHDTERNYTEYVVTDKTTGTNYLVIKDTHNCFSIEIY